MHYLSCPPKCPQLLNIAVLKAGAAVVGFTHGCMKQECLSAKDFCLHLGVHLCAHTCVGAHLGTLLE